MIDNRDSLAKLVCLFHVMRRQKNRLTFSVEFAQQIPHRAARLRIEPGGRLVEEQNRRIVHQRAPDLQSLNHAAGKTIDLFIGPIDQLEPFEQSSCSRLALLLRHAEIFGVEQKDLTRRQAAIKVVDLRHDADASLDRHRVLRHFKAFNSRRAAGRQNTRRQHANRRGLAGAVRTEQTKKLAARDFK